MLDVVVTDATGRRVPDLTAADFEVSLDGRPQHILSSSFEAAAQEPEAAAAPMLLRPLHHAAARRMVLVVDDLNLSVRGAEHLRETLRRFAGEQMQPGDEVAVIRTSSGVGAQQRFTGDPNSLRAAIDRLKPRSFPGPPAGSIFSAGTIGVLELVFDGLRAFPGRKSVVLFTEAKPANSAGLDILADEANRSFAVFYALDPIGVDTTFQEVTPPVTANPTPRSISPLVANAPAEPLGSIFEALAKATGGLVLDRGDIASEFARVLADRQGYYLLRYSRDFAIFRPATGEKLVEHISVRTTREGLTIRTRDGFPQASGLSPALSVTSEEKLREALLSPFTAGDIRFGLSAIFFHTAKEGLLLKLLMHVDGRDLTFRKALNGVYHYGVDAAFMTLGEGGAPTVQAHVHLGEIPMTEAQHQEALERGTSFEIRALLARPGPYQLRLALSDAMSDRVGSANQFVYVPDVANGQLAISGITVGSALPGEPPIIRLKPAEPLYLTYEIYNLTHGADNRSEIDLQIRLLDTSNQLTSATSVIRFDPSGDPAHRAVTSRISLPSALPPGAYTAQLTVTDKLARTQRRVATQEIVFEIPSP